MTLAEKIRALLRERGWSQSELARRAGLKQRAVCYVASDGRPARADAGVAIAKALSVSTDWLFDDNQDWPPPRQAARAVYRDDTFGTARETCKICYHANAVGFTVPDEVWRAVVPEAHRESVVCLPCFTRLADERGIEWDRYIEFYPVSLISHLRSEGRLDARGNESEEKRPGAAGAAEG